MSVTNEQLAELLSGIARAQQAIIDAVERANGGWKNAHLIPILNVAANMRQADPRLIDLPSRILLRYQGRAAVDSATVIADLERLFSQPISSTAADPAAATAPSAPRFAARASAPAAAPAAPAAAAAPAPTAAVAPKPAAPAAGGGEELDFSKR
jgi:hypothetical protein